MGFVSPAAIKESSTACYHCGEACPSAPILSDEKAFCCIGCQTVYKLLQDHQLDGFYRLQEGAGSSLRGKKTTSYAWLEDPDIQQKLIQYADDKQIRIQLSLPQIHCISCVWLLEHLHQLHPGVIAARVNFLRRQSNITIDRKQLSLPALMELLDKIGYPPQLQFEDLKKTPLAPPIQRKSIYQLGVAGFAFGNIMLLSFPEYLGISLIDSGGLPLLLGYLSIFLILPVITYSAQDYWRSAYFGFRRKRLSIDIPIALGMTVLFARSVFEIISQTGTGYLDSLAGLIFFLLVGKWFQQKTFHRLSFDRDYQSYFPIAVQKLENGIETAVSLDKLKVADQLVIRHSELIPADAILIEGVANVDYSFVSGEAEPLILTKGSQLYAGGRQLGAAITIQLNKLPAQSYLTELWNDSAFAEEDQTDQIIQKLSPWFTGTILLLAIITLIYWFPTDPALAFNAFTAVLIIACPCAIALATPFVFGNGLRLLGRKNIYLKNANVIEQLARINTLVFDKTGTLTQTQQSAISYHGKDLSLKEKNGLIHLAAQSTHPISQSIAAQQSSSSAVNISQFQEISGQGIQASVDGYELRLGSSAFIHRIDQKEQSPGTWFAVDGEVKGYFRLKSTYRESVEQLFADPNVPAARFLLSGDDDRDRSQLQQYFKEPNIHFRQKPADKLNFIRGLQKNGSTVLMLGDGLNDAGALRQSDVGIVLSENTNNFTPASDAILSADRLGQLGAILGFAKHSVWLVYACFGLAFLYNFIGLSYAVTGQLSPVVAAILMPISSISIALLGVMGSTVLARFDLGKEGH